jgi:hypothetical protein
MLRFVAAAAIVVGLVAIRPAAAADTTKSIKGTVKSVAADSLTVTDKDNKDWTFTVATKTKVIVVGGSHKTAETKAMNKVPTITDALKAGDKVTVKYWEAGDTMTAAEVKVL